MTYRPEDHTYWDDLGNRVPSVSEILRARGLCGDYSFCPPGARERGSRVHLITEELDRYGETLMEIDDEVAPYISAYRSWKVSMEHAVMKFKAIEVPVFGEMDCLVYGGRVDRVARICGLDGNVVLDIKTGSPAAWHCVQLAAYALALGLQNAAALYLDKSAGIGSASFLTLRWTKPWPSGGGPAWHGGIRMGKVTWTGKPLFSYPESSLALHFDIPKCEDFSVRELYQYALKKAGGYLSITLDLPKRPRSTGPKSQNNRANGFMRQIANATGNSFAAVEAACKFLALDEGYPVEQVLGKWVAKSQADLTVEECAAFIATIERIAAEEGIPLQEE